MVVANDFQAERSIFPEPVYLSVKRSTLTHGMLYSTELTVSMGGNAR